MCFSSTITSVQSVPSMLIAIDEMMSPKLAPIIVVLPPEVGVDETDVIVGAIK